MSGGSGGRAVDAMAAAVVMEGWHSMPQVQHLDRAPADPVPGGEAAPTDPPPVAPGGEVRVTVEELAQRHDGAAQTAERLLGELTGSEGVDETRAEELGRQVDRAIAEADRWGRLHAVRLRAERETAELGRERESLERPARVPRGRGRHRPVALGRGRRRHDGGAVRPPFRAAGGVPDGR